MSEKTLRVSAAPTPFWEEGVSGLENVQLPTVGSQPLLLSVLSLPAQHRPQKSITAPKPYALRQQKSGKRKDVYAPVTDAEVCLTCPKPWQNVVVWAGVATEMKERCSSCPPCGEGRASPPGREG